MLLTAEANKFRNGLKKRGFNCSQLARLWNISPVTVRSWHCGRVRIPRARLRQLEEMK